MLQQIAKTDKISQKHTKLPLTLIHLFCQMFSCDHLTRQINTLKDVTHFLCVHNENIKITR